MSEEDFHQPPWGTSTSSLIGVLDSQDVICHLIHQGLESLLFRV